MEDRRDVPQEFGGWLTIVVFKSHFRKPFFYCRVLQRNLKARITLKKNPKTEFSRQSVTRDHNNFGTQTMFCLLPKRCETLMFHTTLGGGHDKKDTRNGILLLVALALKCPRDPAFTNSSRRISWFNTGPRWTCRSAPGDDLKWWWSVFMVSTGVNGLLVISDVRPHRNLTALIGQNAWNVPKMR